jgi:hypothetical protein
MPFRYAKGAVHTVTLNGEENSEALLGGQIVSWYVSIKREDRGQHALSQSRSSEL